VEGRLDETYNLYMDNISSGRTSIAEVNMPDLCYTRACEEQRLFDNRHSGEQRRANNFVNATSRVILKEPEQYHWFF
jgi:hypothetical protein